MYRSNFTEKGKERKRRGRERERERRMERKKNHRTTKDICVTLLISFVYFSNYITNGLIFLTVQLVLIIICANRYHRLMSSLFERLVTRYHCCNSLILYRSSEKLCYCVTHSLDSVTVIQRFCKLQRMHDGVTLTGGCHRRLPS